jgi:CubicO group peptidase (beta-lactamase class C family)
MRIRYPVGLICTAAILQLTLPAARAEDFTSAIQAFLHQRVEVEKRVVGMVVRIVDEHGTRIVSCGKMGDGSDRGVDGDTLFELGSITKTFTALLLQDMVERGQMKLRDPVAKYLPLSVKVPAHNGKPITLLHLATHTSGLPFLPKNLHPKRMENPYADYTVDQLYAFLSSFQLTRDPGTKWEYSEVGMQLLGQAIALQACTNYEKLLQERICGPLRMDSTRVSLTPELKLRLATGHNQLACVVPGLDFQSLVGGSALHSSANDLLKYAAANLGLIPCGLTPLMQKMQTPRFPLGGGSHIGLTWITTRDLPGTDLVFHGGETFGHTAWLGFDKARKRGVVVLASSSPEILGLSRLGWLLLESEWRPENRLQPARGGGISFDDSVLGQYQLAPSFALGVFTLHVIFLNSPKMTLIVGAGLVLGLVLLVYWRVARSRRAKHDAADASTVELITRSGLWPLGAWRR